MQDVFNFKGFAVKQSLCAMKVGTDGVLLGAWAEGGQKMLDIGTGSGLIAMMIKTRYPSSEITAIDIDEGACTQAQQNIRENGMNGITIAHLSLQQLCRQAEEDKDLRFDAIITNPPFFAQSMHCDDHSRTMARHTDSLNDRDLLAAADMLLSADGKMSVILPADRYDSFEQETITKGFAITRNCMIRTLKHKPVKRLLLEVKKYDRDLQYSQEEVVLMQDDGTRSDWYRSLTQDFYIR